jgi:putative colanic acid biosynthesis acetyltransferase WcaF
MVVEGADGAHGASFSLANRLLRLVWWVVWIGLFRPSPRPFHAWRAFLLRVFGAKIGRNVHVYPGVRVWAPWMLEIGDDTGIGSGVNLYSMAPIRIGVRCVISQGAHLCCGSHDYSTPHFQLTARPIHIGSQVWVCADAFIGPGVAVLEGSVIGARAVMMRSTAEPWHVWSGNPAVMCKRRVIRGR